MQAISEKREYYTYEEACQALDVSYAHLARAIGYGVFYPVHLEKGAKKYLLKSEVDAMIGKQLFTQRKPKNSKVARGLLNDMNELAGTGDIATPGASTMVATVIMKVLHGFELYAQMMNENRKEDNSRLDSMWQQAMNATSRGLSLIVDQNVSKEQAELFSKDYLSALDKMKSLV